MTRDVVRNAAIEVCTASLAVITVNNKQMTLSVFRQLQESCPIEWRDGSFVATFPFWGTVNYHWGECPKAEHLHVVWSDDEGSLFRYTMRRIEHDYFEEGGRFWISHPWGLEFDLNREVRFCVGVVSEVPHDASQQIEVKREWLQFYEQAESLRQLFIAV